MPSARLQFESQEVVVVHLSDEERTAGKMSLGNVGKAVAAMHRDGIVVLENAVDTEHVDKLNTILSEEAEAMPKLPTTHFNNVSESQFFPLVILLTSLPELGQRETDRKYVTRTSTVSGADVRRHLGKFSGG